LKDVLARLVEGQGLSSSEAEAALREIMSGNSSPAQMAAFLTAMRMKGETEEELYGMARLMRELCVKVELGDSSQAIDIVGTGGDRVKTINVSTISSLIVASVGVKVAKHGNRAASGFCGSADLLEEVGVNINLGPDGVRRCVEKCGFGFMFAPLYHPAMKNVAPVRRELGFRTFFNLLGPMTNPSGVGVMLVGVSDNRYLLKVARVFSRLGLERCLIVCSSDGVDEISIQGMTEACWVERGEIRGWKISPGDFGLKPSSLEPAVVRSREDAVKRAVDILRGRLSSEDPNMRLVLVNSAAALFLSGRCGSLREGVEAAHSAVLEGRVLETLFKVVELSGGELERCRALVGGGA